jgi:hypothetical protein
MVLAGKELGKDVGQTEYRCKWDQVRRCCKRYRLNADDSFRSPVQSFPDASLGISVADDCQTFICMPGITSPTQSPRPPKLSSWGDRAVVVLIGI